MDNKTNKPTYEQLEALAAEQDALLLSYAKIAGNNAAKVQQLEAQVKSLAAENAALKSGAGFFSYGSEHGFEWHKSAKEAIESADGAIDDYRGDACDGWSEEVDSVCWGVIMQSSTKVGERPRTEDDSCDPAIDTICDYVLLPAIETPATDAYLSQLRNEARAEGAHFVANRMLAAWGAGFIEDTAKNAADIARMILTSTEFMADAPEGDFDRSFADGVLEGIARQLREGKASPQSTTIEYPKNNSSSNGWTIDPQFLSRVSDRAEAVYGYRPGLEETEAALLAGLDLLREGKAGEVVSE